MTYTVTTHRDLFTATSKLRAKQFASMVSRDICPPVGHSANISDLDSAILVTDENANEIAVYNFTKNAIKSINNSGY